MQITHATFVSGDIDPAYFGKSSIVQLSSVFLSMEAPDADFTSMGLLANLSNSGPLYKIFSRHYLTDDILSRLFIRYNKGTVQRREWAAYPVLTPNSDFAPFELSPGLYYVNSIETAASALEMSAIAAKNVVNMMVGRFGGGSGSGGSDGGKDSKISEEHKKTEL